MRQDTVSKNALVLVVEDEPYIRTAISRILEHAGYEVITAHDGETSLMLTELKKPEVVLLDILMPGIDGREVCRKIRKNYPATRIIYFSAKIELDKVKAQELLDESDAFLAKPATTKQILSKVSDVLV